MTPMTTTRTRRAAAPSCSPARCSTGSSPTSRRSTADPQPQAAARGVQMRRLPARGRGRRRGHAAEGAVPHRRPHGSRPPHAREPRGAARRVQPPPARRQGRGGRGRGGRGRRGRRARGKAFHAMTKAPKWKALQPALHAFFQAVLHLLGSSTEPSLLLLVLQKLRHYVPFLVPFPKFARKLLKLLLHAWADGARTGDARTLAQLQTVAFLRVRQLALAQPYPFVELCLKGAYLAYVRNAKFVNEQSAPRRPDARLRRRAVRARPRRDVPARVRLDPPARAPPAQRDGPQHEGREGHAPARVQLAVRQLPQAVGGRALGARRAQPAARARPPARADHPRRDLPRAERALLPVPLPLLPAAPPARRERTVYIPTPGVLLDVLECAELAKKPAADGRAARAPARRQARRRRGRDARGAGRGRVRGARAAAARDRRLPLQRRLPRAHRARVMRLRAFAKATKVPRWASPRARSSTRSTSRRAGSSSAARARSRSRPRT